MALTDAQKDAQLAAQNSPYAPGAVPAFNPASGNPFLNAVGSTKTTPVVSTELANAQNALADVRYAEGASNAATAASEKAAGTYFDPMAMQAPAYKTPAQLAAEAAAVAEKKATDAQKASEQSAAKTTGQTSQVSQQAISDAQGAFDLLKSEFEKYGLGTLVDSIKGLIQQGASGATMTLALQNTDAYKKRFSANQDRIAKGLSALTPAQYVGLEDQYQNVMRNYGLPASYYTKDSTGKQPGFDQLLANDVSAVELQDRVATAQDRVLNSNPDVLKTLKQFYPDITNGDILAYALDPKNALTALKQKVTTSEIGAAQLGAGLASGQTPEQIANYAANAQLLQQAGVTGQQAAQGFGQVAQLAQRGNQLSDIYGQAPYGQQQAQAEVFNLAGQTDAANQRKKLTALEQAQFAGQGGTAQNAFSRERAISPMMLGVPGAGSF